MGRAKPGRNGSISCTDLIGGDDDCLWQTEALILVSILELEVAVSSDHLSQHDLDNQIREMKKQLRGISFNLFLMNYGKYFSAVALLAVFLPLWLILGVRWWIALPTALLVAGIVHFAVGRHVMNVTRKVIGGGF